jgi:hypothetical protein
VKWYQLQSSTANQQLVRRLVKELKLPGQTLIFVTEKNLTSLGRKIARLSGTEVFVRHRD